MSGVVVIEAEGVLSLKRQFQLLKMSIPKRKRLLQLVSRQIIRDTVKRTRQQIDIHGKPFPTHARRRKRKMLTRLVRRIATKSVTGTQAVIGFRNPVEAEIGSKQQFGYVEHFSADELRRNTIAGDKRTAKNSARYGSQAFREASKRQAVVLKSLGFKKQSGESGRKQPATISWIQQNLTAARAGIIIRSMRDKQGISRNPSWDTVLPARPFLGVTDEELASHVRTIFEGVLADVDSGKVNLGMPKTEEYYRPNLNKTFNKPTRKMK